MTSPTTSTQTLVSDINRTYDSIAQNAELSCIYIRGLMDFSSLSPHEKVRYSALSVQALRSLEELHVQWLEGLVDARIWSGLDRQMSAAIQAPGFQQWWMTRRHWFGEEFQAFLDSKIAEGSGSQSASFGESDCAVQS